jgi:maltose O-acetyltransferase
MSAPHLTNPRICPPEGDEDPTELINMISARPYKAFDAYVGRLRDTQAARVLEIDDIRDMEKRMEHMRGFINMGKEVYIVNRFFCEYVSCCP